MNKVYAFLYCECIHESSYATMSLHYSKEGAEKAMKEHKKAEKKRYNEIYKGEINLNKKLGISFGMHEGWQVQEIEILP